MRMFIISCLVDKRQSQPVLISSSVGKKQMIRVSYPSVNEETRGL